MLGQRAKFDVIRSIDSASFAGVAQAVGSPLTHNPRWVVIQNDSNVPVVVTDSLDANTGMPFRPSERVIFDCEANRDGRNNEFSWDVDTQFYAIGAADMSNDGSVNISIVYAKGPL